MASDDEKKIVKKVQPYPFPLTIHKDGQPLIGQVLKLAQKGAIIRADNFVPSVASEFKVSFEIPVHKVQMSLDAKVIKTYDRAVVGENKVEHLAEIHFPKITNEQIRSIYKFLVAIKQVAP